MIGIQVDSSVRIGGYIIGKTQPCYVIAEIGINHNGDLDLVRKLIEAAAVAGCDAVKFQKRTVEVVYTQEELDRPRSNPFGTTNGDLKHGLELGYEQYEAIDRHCKSLGIAWFASCWDEQSVDFIDQFSVPAYKIASASLTDHQLLKYTRSKGRPIILSTGMSTLEQLDRAVDVLGSEDLVLLHTCSVYPSAESDLNLRTIPILNQRYGVPAGYSGHERGIAPSIAAVALGACVIERHITLDRTLWGSDQSASIEPNEFQTLVSSIRQVEAALGDGVKRLVPGEIPIMQKLRRVV
jgi:N-acetylneuraminate synthase